MREVQMAFQVAQVRNFPKKHKQKRENANILRFLAAAVVRELMRPSLLQLRLAAARTEIDEFRRSGKSWRRPSWAQCRGAGSARSSAAPPEGRSAGTLRPKRSSACLSEEKSKTNFIYISCFHPSSGRLNFLSDRFDHELPDGRTAEGHPAPPSWPICGSAPRTCWTKRCPVTGSRRRLRPPPTRRWWRRSEVTCCVARWSASVSGTRSADSSLPSPWRCSSWWALQWGEDNVKSFVFKAQRIDDGTT